MDKHAQYICMYDAYVFLQRETWSYILLATSLYLSFGLVIKQLNVIYDNYTLQQSCKWALTHLRNMFCFRASTT